MKSKLFQNTMKAVIASLFCVALAACESGEERAAKDALADALLMENAGKQRKAAVIYTRIIEFYPKTKAAEYARGRVDVHRENVYKEAEAALSH